MSDILVLVVLVAVPAALALGPLALLTLGIAAVADLDDNGLVRPAGTRQPGPGSSSIAPAAAGSLTSGPAARMSGVTPSA
jgi:hypothetical protein